MMGYLMRDLRDIYKLVLAVRNLVRDLARANPYDEES